MSAHDVPAQTLPTNLEPRAALARGALFLIRTLLLRKFGRAGRAIDPTGDWPEAAMQANVKQRESAAR